MLLVLANVLFHDRVNFYVQEYCCTLKTVSTCLKKNICRVGDDIRATLCQPHLVVSATTGHPNTTAHHAERQGLFSNVH